MKTKEIFNFERFGKYFVSDLKTCRANYGLSLLVISVLVPLATYIMTIGVKAIAENAWEGPSIFFRGSVFVIAMLCMTITMPVKCYGRLTEKQYGSFWLSLPASRLEKFLSMILIVTIIAPAASAVIYLGVDFLNCLVDRTCGMSIIGGIIKLFRGIEPMKSEIMVNIMAEEPELVESMKTIMQQMFSPWIYIDEYIVACLPFLLGAIFFKNGKVVKTFLAIAAFGTIVSFIATPLMAGHYIKLLENDMTDPVAVMQFYSTGVFKHLELIDTLTDTITNVAMLTAIWFRLKTLKH